VSPTFAFKLGPNDRLYYSIQVSTPQRDCRGRATLLGHLREFGQIIIGESAAFKITVFDLVSLIPDPAPPGAGLRGRRSGTLST
jgi:hypothetical protein